MCLFTKLFYGSFFLFIHNFIYTRNLHVILSKFVHVIAFICSSVYTTCRRIMYNFKQVNHLHKYMMNVHQLLDFSYVYVNC